MRTLFSIVGIILLAAAGFVAYVFLTLDPEELGQKILEKVNQEAGVEVAAESFEVRPLKGVTLLNGSLQGELESGMVSGSLERMVFDYRLLPLLKGEVVVHQILLEGPNLEVVSQPGEVTPLEDSEETDSTADRTTTETDRAPVSTKAKSRFISAVSVSEIRVTDGNLKVVEAGSSSGGLRILGLDFELGDLFLDSNAASASLGLAARGSVRIEKVLLDEMTIKGGRGNMALDHGRLSITDLGIETVNANLEVAEIAVDLTQEPPPYRLDVGGSYDLNSLVEATNEGFGRASLEFAATGAGPDLDRMQAEGTFRLENGQIPAFPMMVRIERLLGRSLLVGYPYEGTDIVFAISDGRVVVEPFVMGFENLQMAGGGTIDVTGPIDMQIDVRLPRESISNSTLDPFIDGMTDEDGWTTVPFDIAGTMAEPDVEFDMTSIKNTAKDMGKRAVTEALDYALGDLKEKTFRRRQKDDG